MRANFSFNAVKVCARSCACTADDLTAVAVETEEVSVAVGAAAGGAAISAVAAEEAISGTCNPLDGICSGV